MGVWLHEDTLVPTYSVARLVAVEAMAAVGLDPTDTTKRNKIILAISHIVDSVLDDVSNGKWLGPHATEEAPQVDKPDTDKDTLAFKRDLAITILRPLIARAYENGLPQKGSPFAIATSVAEHVEAICVAMEQIQ